MELILLAAFPIPLRLLTGLGILLIGVLTAFWFFMTKNNSRSRSIDGMPPNNDARKLQDQYGRGEISEEEYRRALNDLEKNSRSH